MSSHLVRGVALPDQVAGHPALELCNTRAGWGEPSPKEYLRDFAALALWTGDVGLLPGARVDAVLSDAADRPRLAPRELEVVRSLRDDLYALVSDPGRATEMAARLHARVAEAVAAATYVVPPGDAGTWRLAVDELEPALTAPRHAAVLAVHDLLTAWGPSAVGVCPGQGCGWVFLDPPGRRRWCTMAICGNRAKARRYATRRRGAAAPTA